MADHHPKIGAAKRLRGLHVFNEANAEARRAHEPGVEGNRRDANGQHDVGEPRPQCGDDRERKQQPRECQHRIDHAHDHAVGAAPIVYCDEAHHGPCC